MKPDRHSTKKIILALALSATCYGLTHSIYLWTEPEASNSQNSEPIAYTTRVNDEVQRRPVARMIWHLLNSGEPVYPGEAIRTSSHGEVRIQFVGSERILDLEADTMIVLTRKENEIALDLLDGSVFVAQNESKSSSTDSKLTLKSKQGAIDLSKATASLSNTAGKIELQVVKGEALIDSEGEQKSIKSGDSSSQIQILEPKGEQPLFVTGLNAKPVRFKWQGASEGLPIELWMGAQRKMLKLQSRILNTPEAEIRADLKPGKYFWQLKSPSSGETQIQRLEVISLLSPQPLTPVSGQNIIFEKDPGSLELSWSHPPGTESVTLEIAKDAAFTQVIQTEVIPSSKTFSLRNLSKGKYYWRVSSYYPKYQQMASSPIWNFEIEIGTRKLTNVLWSENLGHENFFVDRPKLNLAWKESEEGRAKSWIIRLAPSEQELANPNSNQTLKIETQNQNIESPLPQSGRWLASVEGLDSAGNRVSKSEVREFQLSPLPLIAAPLLLPLEGEFKSTPRGDLKLEWAPVAGAVEYWVVLKNSDGKDLQSKKVSKNNMSLDDLMPGSYELELYAKDEFGRKSQAGSSRKLVVPESSGLSAPKLRRIKVN